MSFEGPALLSKTCNSSVQPCSRLDAVCLIRIPWSKTRGASIASPFNMLYRNGIRPPSDQHLIRRRKQGYTNLQPVQACHHDSNTDLAPSSSVDVDLYEVLGVDRNASQQEIRRSYRWLQKKCHPDVAGPQLGHRMSILINHAYSTLAHPDKRAAYDQSLQDSAELDGYTGRPLYSKWLGPAHETQAVFVDEGHCVGCLKCALIAPRTFAIENRYGRARAVAHWADPKPVIEDAIKSCPVDCITWVDRSQLPAFEYVMSKAPRYPIGAIGNGGVKPVDVFKSVDRFLDKLRQAEESKMRKESSAQRDARLAAMEEINRAAGRWAWQFINFSVNGKSGMPGLYNDIYRWRGGAIVPVQNSNSNDHQYINNSERPDSEVLRRLYDVLSREGESGKRTHSVSEQDDEYWKPSTIISVSTGSVSGDTLENSMHTLQLGQFDNIIISSTAADDQQLIERIGQLGPSSASGDDDEDGWSKELVRCMPVWSCGVAAWFVGVTDPMATGISMSEMKDDVGIAPVPVEWIGSSEMRILLVAIIWYMIGAVIANTAALLTRWLSRSVASTIEE